MSTGVYRSEQIVHYGRSEDSARTYWGFYISWSGGEDDCAYPFSEAARLEDWVAAVGEAAKTIHATKGGGEGKEPWDEWDIEYAAALFACAEWGPESNREGLRYCISDEFTESVIEMLSDLADRFDPSGKPGTPPQPPEEPGALGVGLQHP